MIQNSILFIHYFILFENMQCINIVIMKGFELKVISKMSFHYLFHVEGDDVYFLSRGMIILIHLKEYL